jgi:hypothetical protein
MVGEVKSTLGAIGWTVEHSNFGNQDACGWYARRNYQQDVSPANGTSS